MGSRGTGFRAPGLISSRELGPMGSKGAGPHGCPDSFSSRVLGPGTPKPITSRVTGSRVLMDSRGPATQLALWGLGPWALGALQTLSVAITLSFNFFSFLSPFSFSSFPSFSFPLLFPSLPPLLCISISKEGLSVGPSICRSVRLTCFRQNSRKSRISHVEQNGGQ